MTALTESKVSLKDLIMQPACIGCPVCIFRLSIKHILLKNTIFYTCTLVPFLMKFERPSKNPGYGPAILWCYANLFIIISSSMPSNDDDFIGMAANRLDKLQSTV